MFFIGLASSFIPYLLFFGVLLFLTLSSFKGQEEKLVNLEAKTIENYESNTQQNIDSKSTCYYTNIVETQSSQENVSTAIEDFQINEPYAVPKRWTLFKEPAYNYHFYNLYPGLSPPSLIA